ncbi:hypothetical protein OHT77_02050 [Streptomyces sp. NBC_00252]|uniref:hypothetical protein n=1 Tax=Streptomyces sp. NBC_00252 TaxID=2975691 RepID=UPI002E2E7408|nr:hypothetical protein [Streptomyces sp. NBC_00252]
MNAESADHREPHDLDEGGADEADTARIPSSLEGEARRGGTGVEAAPGGDIPAKRRYRQEQVPPPLPLHRAGGRGGSIGQGLTCDA